MKSRKTAPGRPLADERRKFLELVGQGVSIREASRIVGINRRTGQEWMNGRAARVRTTKPSVTRTRPAMQPVTGKVRSKPSGTASLSMLQ
ncbi:helix-turn-helix domain-containing protein [Streptomyces sp. NPDC048637]|uniref:helix-turn-helix domain-containing protein n=1 Tax=Streptomyces sp. NPDC048637 TaxID=3155636 RepID=UPI00341DAA8E